MLRQTTLVQDPAILDEPRPFTFDFSYWSHDGYRLTDTGYLQAENGRYIDQRTVFSDLGRGLLDNAWLGYNCTVIAYGQTGSGKTYTMMGNGPNKGIIPQICETLFETIGCKNQRSSAIYQVSISMLEIYNEKVFDLLRDHEQDDSRDQGLRVRRSPKYGFYVEGLTSHPVARYRDIEYLIEAGNKNRTLAATRMNENSSRAHTIVTLNVVQNFIRENKTKQSNIFMVDLAGSERASQTGTTGVRFEESRNINKSLMTLGTVIKNLCASDKDMSTKAPIPHRDSKLTMILKDAIGGNSKTIMIATVSPAEEDATQTLSTLRYAERVKSIKNKMKMNVCKTDTLIRELLAEKEALLARLSGRCHSQQGYTEQEIERLKKEQVAEIEQILQEKKDIESAWQRRLEVATRQLEAQKANERREILDKTRVPHLCNLNVDPTLSGKVSHFIRPGVPVTVGNTRAEIPNDIELHGASIAKDHVVLHNRSSRVTLTPKQGQVRLNGENVTKEIVLVHQDRVFFGANNMFVFNNPQEERKLRAAGAVLMEVTYDMARDELGRHTVTSDQVDASLKLELAETLTLTHEAVAMAKCLGRNVLFEPVVIAKLVLGPDVNRSQTDIGGEFIWSREHFLDRLDLMSDMYQRFESGEPDWEPKLKTQDPFWEPLETPTLVGVAYLPLESLAYMLGIGPQELGIYDYRACQTGMLTVSLVPCTEAGEECPEDRVVEEPSELTWCHYTFLQECQPVHTKEVQGIVPRYNFEHTHTITKTSLQTVQYLEEKMIMVEVYGRQKSGVAYLSDRYYHAYTLRDRRRSSHVIIPPTRSRESSLSTCSMDRRTINTVSGERPTVHEDYSHLSPAVSAVALEDEDVISTFPVHDVISNEEDYSPFSNRQVAYRQMREGIGHVMRDVLSKDRSFIRGELNNTTRENNTRTIHHNNIPPHNTNASTGDSGAEDQEEMQKMLDILDDVYNRIGDREDELASDIRYILEN